MADQTGDGPTGQAPPPPPVDPLLAPRLTAEQLALLRGYGEKRPTVAGQVLFREGDRGYDFIVDGLGVGGQIGTTSSIENYLGFPVGVSGEEFAERALVQVLRFGPTLLVPSTAAGLAGRGDRYVIQLGAEGELAARTVIIATGVTYRKLEAAGLDQFEGTGVFYTPLAAPDQPRQPDPVYLGQGIPCPDRYRPHPGRQACGLSRELRDPRANRRSPRR